MVDLLQIIITAASSAFGIGIANEITHAFREYRKLLKERLLNDTVESIKIYRRLKAEYRYFNAVRIAKTPFSVYREAKELPPRTPLVIYTDPVPDPIVHHPLQREAAVPKKPLAPRLKYIPEQPRPTQMDDVPARMADWEEN